VNESNRTSGETTGRVIVTGTGGLGFETALALAKLGWKVIIAGRNPGKGAAAVKEIKSQIPQASLVFEQVDLADLASIAAFGRRLNAVYERIDMLINNAGVMTPPRRQVTADGFELQFGVNYLAHFALTAHLLPLLRRGRTPKVITVSSIASRDARINFEDLQSERAYKAFEAYGQSKLAQLMFAFELQRRSQKNGWGVASLAAHPGLARTELIPNGSGRLSGSFLLRQLLWFVFQSPAQGACPTLFAATSPAATPGGYYGPDRWSEVRGSPASARIPERAQDRKDAAQLWDLSERLIGISLGESNSADFQPQQTASR
jgi:NAD(P)-dependent dehydrogenase (short-subunit alcohol dehydrogenase family)